MRPKNTSPLVWREELNYWGIPLEATVEETVQAVQRKETSPPQVAQKTKSPPRRRYSLSADDDLIRNLNPRSAPRQRRTSVSQLDYRSRQKSRLRSSSN